ncbi:MAG: class I SAM-dependent methyltransferase [Solirubrobacterales bacterium]
MATEPDRSAELPQVLIDEYRKAPPAEPEAPLLGPRDQVIASKPSNAPIEEETAALLARLTRELDARRTIETGMAAGHSAVAIASVHAERGEGIHTCVDPYQTAQWKSAGLDLAEKAGVRDFITLVEEPSELALPAFAADGYRLGLAFVDGLHLFDHALIDFFYLDRMLEVGGVVVFHDTWMPAIQKAVGYVVSNRAYERIEGRTPEIERETNLAALRKTGMDDRDWFFDRPFDEALYDPPGQPPSDRGRPGHEVESLE